MASPKDDPTYREKVALWVGALTVPGVIIFYGSLLLLDGFLFSTMWNWWISPVFSVRELKVVDAIAISLLIGYFKPYKEIPKNQALKLLGKNLLKDLVVFGLVWMLLLFK